MRRNICCSLSDTTLDEIDSKRGLIPRSRYIESLISNGLENDNNASYTHTGGNMKQEEGSAGVSTASNTETPTPLSSTRDEVDNGISS